jgi:UDP-glucose 4-epimerase
MSLDDSVKLVLHAFKTAQQGDIFVQKAPASSIGVLAKAIQSILKSDAPVKIIGTRHGEKLFESLLSKEEVLRVTETDDFYCLPADNRDLNYNKFFVEGVPEITEVEDYNSHNTTQLNIDEVRQLLINTNSVLSNIYA